MTPRADSQEKQAAEARPLDFHGWLQRNGMNPSRRRPPGRTAALLMDYRAYLERTVGPANAAEWFEKYARKAKSNVAPES